MEQFNSLIESRQAIYNQGFTRAKDAQFELLDALLLGQPIRSFPELSLLPVFRRKWPSIYAAIKEGRQDRAWLEGYFIRQIPMEGPLLFSLDGTAWPHPAARTLADLQYVYSPTPAVDGGSIVVRSRGLGDVYKRQGYPRVAAVGRPQFLSDERPASSRTLESA